MSQLGVTVSGVPGSTYSFYVVTTDVCSSCGGPSYPSSSNSNTVSLTVPPSSSSVTFTESGLASGTSWGVTFNGQTQFQTTSTITFTSVSNGQYAWSLASPIPGGYTGSPSTGTVTVNGANVNQPITFTRVYTVTFTESGLPSGTQWQVTFNGITQGGTANSVSFYTMPNGQYSFTVGSVAGYIPSPSTGTVTVNGANVNQPITFDSAQLSNWMLDSRITVTQNTLSTVTLGSTSITDAFTQNPVTVYMLQPSSSSGVGFDQALSDYFSVSIPAQYKPSYAMLIHIPMVGIVDTMFGTNYPQQTYEFGFPSNLSPALFGGNAMIRTTQDGSINLLITSSIPIGEALTPQHVGDVVGAALSTLEFALKHNPSELISALKDALNAAVATGDTTFTIVTSSLSSIGSLSAYALLDIYHLAQTIGTVLEASGMLLALLNIYKDYQELSAYLLLLIASQGIPVIDFVGFVVFGALAIAKFVQLAFSVFDFIIDLLGDVFTDLNNNWFYVLLRTSLDFVTAKIDPDNTIIVPTYYDSAHKIVLGYNESSGATVFNSPSGTLVELADSYYAYLAENAAAPTAYSSRLMTVGGNGTVPYLVTVRSYVDTAGVLNYAGLVPGGGATTLEVPVGTDGSLVPQSYLVPRVNVTNSGDNYVITALPFFSNGTETTATEGFIVIEGISYRMFKSASTFTISVPKSLITSDSTSLYLVKPGIVGGYVALHLPSYSGPASTSGAGGRAWMKCLI
ncbi:MAG: hypothetical protein HY247_06385 [archaeon]|nr:MAG: hypothetical protein HY247_06385 [archaeon]